MASASPPLGLSPPFKKSRIGCSPSVFPASGFEVIDPNLLVEEERLPTYDRTNYYPMRIGDIVDGHYQVVAKLGYGGSSTVWLARDLNKERLYRALKVHVHNAPYYHELSVYEHLKKPIQQEIDDKDTHPGRDHVRQLDDVFMIDGPHGQHAVFVMVPLGMSLATMQTGQQTGAFQPIFVTQALSQALLGLALLHSADLIHTDLHADNLLIALTDESILSTIEESEITKPSPRKQIGGDTTIHVSQYVFGGAGPLTISDLGQARIGRTQTDKAMPIQYRAPEVILGMPWGTPVDMWSAGMLVWTLLEPKSLFHVYDMASPELNDAHHLAAMTSLLGPPPKEFRDRSEESSKYWDEQGNWQGPVPLPPKTSLADLVTTLQGEQKALFVDLLECLLTWLPEGRLTADQTYFHPWLRGDDENGDQES